MSQLYQLVSTHKLKLDDAVEEPQQCCLRRYTLTREQALQKRKVIQHQLEPLSFLLPTELNVDNVQPIMTALIEKMLKYYNIDYMVEYLMFDRDYYKITPLTNNRFIYLDYNHPFWKIKWIQISGFKLLSDDPLIRYVLDYLKLKDNGLIDDKRYDYDPELEDLDLIQQSYLESDEVEKLFNFEIRQKVKVWHKLILTDEKTFFDIDKIKRNLIYLKQRKCYTVIDCTDYNLTMIYKLKELAECFNLKLLNECWWLLPDKRDLSLLTDPSNIYLAFECGNIKPYVRDIKNWLIDTACSLPNHLPFFQLSIRSNSFSDVILTYLARKSYTVLLSNPVYLYYLESVRVINNIIHINLATIKDLNLFINTFNHLLDLNNIDYRKITFGDNRGRGADLPGGRYHNYLIERLKLEKQGYTNVRIIDNYIVYQTRTAELQDFKNQVAGKILVQTSPLIPASLIDIDKVTFLDGRITQPNFIPYFRDSKEQVLDYSQDVNIKLTEKKDAVLDEEYLIFLRQRFKDPKLTWKKFYSLPGDNVLKKYMNREGLITVRKVEDKNLFKKLLVEAQFKGFLPLYPGSDYDHDIVSLNTDLSKIKFEPLFELRYQNKKFIYDIKIKSSSNSKLCILDDDSEIEWVSMLVDKIDDKTDEKIMNKLSEYWLSRSNDFITPWGLIYLDNKYKISYVFSHKLTFRAK